jgi:hypothetical protein
VSAVYRDPIYGIPHFHDPGLTRIMRKHDPSYQISESMKLLFAKSDQRFRAIQGSKPRCLHSRFNIEALTTSPLLAFPHFMDMTDYLQRWFDTRDKRLKDAVTLSQRATFEAQQNFSKALFLLLQEASRASPVSPKPLKGIYNWYLQRDSVINASRTVEKEVDLDADIIIELLDGDKIAVPRYVLDASKLGEVAELFLPDQLETAWAHVPVDPPPEPPPKPVPKREKEPEVICMALPPAQMKRTASSLSRRGTFNYDAFHEEMVEQRKADRDVAAIARIVGQRRQAEIAQRPGWQ